MCAVRFGGKRCLPLVLGRSLQALHGAVQCDLALVILVHALLMLQALFGTDAGCLSAVAVDVLRALCAVDQQQNEGRRHFGNAVAHQNIPRFAVDGEMQLNFAMDKDLRDEKYPFNTLKGQDVNTLIFPNLSAANSSYKMVKALEDNDEVVGPIQMGLNKPIHFTDFESSVNDIVNVTAVAVIDAIVAEKKK